MNIHDPSDHWRQSLALNSCKIFWVLWRRSVIWRKEWEANQFYNLKSEFTLHHVPCGQNLWTLMIFSSILIFFFFTFLLCLDLFFLIKENEPKFLLHFIQPISDWLGTVAMNIDWGPRNLHFNHSRALGSLYTWIAVRGRGVEGCRYTCISES